MKSKLFEDRFIIECSCGSPDRLLVIDLFEDEEYTGPVDCSNPLIMEGFKQFSEISFFFTSNWRLPFLKRIITAFKYIVEKEPYFISDSVHIDAQNIEDLEEMIARLRTFLKMEKNDE